jgi:hypothetical protein
MSKIFVTDGEEDMAPWEFDSICEDETLHDHFSYKAPKVPKDSKIFEADFQASEWPIWLQIDPNNCPVGYYIEIKISQNGRVLMQTVKSERKKLDRG